VSLGAEHLNDISTYAEDLSKHMLAEQLFGNVQKGFILEQKMHVFSGWKAVMVRRNVEIRKCEVKF